MASNRTGPRFALPNHESTVVIALALVSAIFLWWATATWPATPDGIFHLQRVRALSESLRAGVLYPRWFPDFAFGYGYPVFNYYAAAFYYPGALLHIAGLDITAATRMTLALVYALGGVGIYLLLRRWTSPLPALAGAVIYQVFPYRLYDLFVRGALPEFAAFFWLPWIALATAHLMDGSDASRALPSALSGRRLLLPALAWSGLILTHNLTAFMAAAGLLMIWPLVALAPRRSGCGSYARRLLKSAGLLFAPLTLAGLLSAWYVLPAIAEARWVALGAAGASSGYTSHFAALGSLFTWAWLYPYPDAAAPTVPLPGYVLVLLVVIGAFFLWPFLRSRTPAGARMCGASLVFAILTLASVWLTTASSAGLWRLLAPVLSNLQFPWRWQTLVTLGTAILAGLAVARVPRLRAARSILSLMVTVAALIYGLARLPTGVPTAAPEITRAAMWAFDREMGQVGASWTGEFLPRDVSEPRWSIGRGPDASDPSSANAVLGLSIQPTQVNYLNRAYETRADGPAQLYFHRFYFPAWQVAVDGTPIIGSAAGPLGLLSVELPAGAHGVTLQWRATPAVWTGRVLSVLGWLLVLWLLGRGGLRYRTAPLGLWLTLGALGLVSMTGATARAAAPTPIVADFGTVRLEAALAPPARAGDVAGVRLFWTVTGAPEPLTAFVHVVDATGTIVAQQDEPLAGVYTPAARWQPGLLLEHEYGVVLPPELLPGSYALKVGVYPPHAPDAPRIPAGATDPRVAAGTLEVRP